MMSREMERWRIFFDQSGEDLWTVIDWALTIAAVNYPKELRTRRDGFAEKLFAPSNYPLVGGSELRNALKEEHEAEEDDDDDEQDDRHNHNQFEEARDGEHGSELEERNKQEILDIGDRLEKLDGSSPEEEFLKYLQLLENIQISFHTLQDTGIGKIVNGLRKHSFKRVSASAKKLIRSWKDVADEWVKTHPEQHGAGNNNHNNNNDDQHEEGEVRGDEQTATARMDLPPHSRELLSSSVSSVTHPSSSYQSLRNEDEDMFRCSPMEVQHNVSLANLPSERSNTKLNGYRRTTLAQPQSTQDVMGNNRAGVAKTNPSTSRKPPTRPFKPPSPETDKLEAAKRRLHEGYQQAANAKKQRTVQVMGLGDVPPDRPSNAKPGGNVYRRPGQNKT